MKSPSPPSPSSLKPFQPFSQEYLNFRLLVMTFGRANWNGSFGKWIVGAENEKGIRKKVEAPLHGEQRSKCHMPNFFFWYILEFL
jgi:hypothetical protein